MISSDIIAVSASIISVLALLFTFLTFKRERNKTNQDFIFQEKIAAYKELIFQANQTYELFYQLVEEVQSYKGSEENWNDFFENECGLYYNLGYDFQKILFRYIPILPNKIYKEMDEFCTEIIFFTTSSYHCNAHITSEAYDKLEITLQKIISLVRTDLNSDRLNIVLSKRLN